MCMASSAVTADGSDEIGTHIIAIGLQVVRAVSGNHASSATPQWRRPPRLRRIEVSGFGHIFDALKYFWQAGS